MKYVMSLCTPTAAVRCYSLPSLCTADELMLCVYCRYAAVHLHSANVLAGWNFVASAATVANGFSSNRMIQHVILVA